MKILILAYDFPPSVRVGGLRPYSWLRYVNEFGVEPIVITRQWSSTYGDDRDYVFSSPTRDSLVEQDRHGTIIRAPYRATLSDRLLVRYGPSRHRLVRRTISAWHEIGQYFLTVGPKKALFRAAREYLRSHAVDAIIATGEPFVLFRYATRLSAEFKVPWIADYRDAWSHDQRSSIKRVSPALEAVLERRFTRSAAAITTVCESMQELLSSFHPGKPVHIVRNGYDPEAIAAARGVGQERDRLTIAFAGTIQAWDPVESFFGACEQIIRTDGRKLELRLFLVNATQDLRALLDTKYPTLARSVRILDRIPNDRVAVELSRSNALVLFNPYSFVGTKVYDYLALNRKILVCYSQDPDALQLKDLNYHILAGAVKDTRPLERLVEETRSGVVVRNAAHLAEVLRDMLDEFDRSGAVASATSDTERFSRRTQAQKLCSILANLGT